MNTREPQSNRDEERGRRDLLIFLLVLLLGLLCLLLTAQIAVRPDRMWWVSASVRSKLDPDRLLPTAPGYLDPLSDLALTPPGWDRILTPEGTPTFVTVQAILITPIQVDDTPTSAAAAISTSEAPISTPKPSMSPPPSPTPTPRAVVMVEAEWPTSLEVKRSGSIRLSLAGVTGETIIPTVEAAGHIVAAATSFSIDGTPEAPIEGLFDLDREASAVASLKGTAFDISPSATDPQSLDQSPVTWEWTILALESGLQTIDACIVARLKSTDSEGDTIEHTIWCSSLEVTVE